MFLNGLVERHTVQMVVYSTSVTILVSALVLRTARAMVVGERFLAQLAFSSRQAPMPAEQKMLSLTSLPAKATEAKAMARMAKHFILTELVGWLVVRKEDLSVDLEGAATGQKE
jgi:hypothetical protein